MSEIRTVAADRLWMSPQYGQDTVGIHFTWKREQDAVERLLADIEAALEPFGARPHWGKLFSAAPGAALRAPAGLRPPRRAARPARRVPERLARTARAGIIHRMTAVANLAHAYHQRRAEFVSEERIGDWRLKLYGLAAPDKGVRPELIETTRRLAAESLPPVDDTHHGAAFAIAHDARFPIALVYLVARRERAPSAPVLRPARRRPRTCRRSRTRAPAACGRWA